jgi:hypothetical protein
MINLPASALLTDLDPLIITSPAIRSGTTLLQRLLCSSQKTLIYGELVAQDLEFFLNLHAIKTQEYSYYRSFFEGGLKQILAGDANNWIPDLMPDVDEYLAAFGQAAFSGIRYCRDYAQRLGRPVWGVKYPGWKPAFIRLLRSLMPRARFIVITRELEACARSAKAQIQFSSGSELKEFCRTWVEGMDFWRSVKGDPAVLALTYEELTVAPEVTLGRLAGFTGVEDIKPDVLHRKINTWTGSKALLDAQNGYVQPAELTDAEQQIIDQVTVEFRRKVYL